MTTNSASSRAKIFAFASVFLTSAGFAYAIVNQFLLDKPNSSLLLIFFSLFMLAIVSWQRMKYKTKSGKKHHS